MQGAPLDTVWRLLRQVGPHLPSDPTTPLWGPTREASVRTEPAHGHLHSSTGTYSRPDTSQRPSAAAAITNSRRPHRGLLLGAGKEHMSTWMAHPAKGPKRPRPGGFIVGRSRNSTETRCVLAWPGVGAVPGTHDGRVRGQTLPCRCVMVAPRLRVFPKLTAWTRAGRVLSYVQANGRTDVITGTELFRSYF